MILDNVRRTRKTMMAGGFPEAVMRIDEYLNDEAVAKLFGVAISTVKRWRLEGRLGFTRIGPRRVVIRPEDVSAFIENGRQPAKAA